LTFRGARVWENENSPRSQDISEFSDHLSNNLEGSCVGCAFSSGVTTSQPNVQSNNCSPPGGKRSEKKVKYKLPSSRISPPEYRRQQENPGCCKTEATFRAAEPSNPTLYEPLNVSIRSLIIKNKKAGKDGVHSSGSQCSQWPPKSGERPNGCEAQNRVVYRGTALYNPIDREVNRTVRASSIHISTTLGGIGISVPGIGETIDLRRRSTRRI
jgi:hypothetical protein